MFKMGSHDPFGHLKHKLWLKEGSGVKNRPDILACRWCATYCWKALHKGYNFVSNFISIGGLHAKLWAPKVTRVLIVGISGLPLGSLGTKWHLGVGHVARHRIYYKGEGGGFPKSGPWWILWVRVCSWWICAPKCSNYALTNLFRLCKSMWINEVLVNLHNPISELQHAPLPLKYYEPGSAPQLLLLPLFLPLDLQLNPSKSLGCISIFLTVRKANVESTNPEYNKVNTMMCCIINKGVWNVYIGSTLWCEMLKCTNFWQAFILMKFLQKYVQKQEYIVLSHNDELVP
jgi:hypothetical protein